MGVRASREGGGQGGGGGEEEEEAGGEGRQEARAHAQVIDGVMDTKVIDGAQLCSSHSSDYHSVTHQNIQPELSYVKGTTLMSKNIIKYLQRVSNMLCLC